MKRRPGKNSVFLFAALARSKPFTKRVKDNNMVESPFRALAHLVEQIGEDGFAALISSDNTGKVKEFVMSLLKVITMLIGDRTYEVLSYLHEGETSISCKTMVARAKEMGVDGSEEAGRHLLENQADIPVEFRGKVVFVFPDWRHPDGSSLIACVYWDDDRWVLGWRWAGHRWRGDVRLLRRK